MPETIRVYEIVYIIAPDRSEEQVRATVDKYNALIAAQGGTVEKTDLWERRRLAYEIKGYTEGLYVVTVFRAYPKVEAELRRVLLISEDTLRFVIVRPDDETVAIQAAPETSGRQQTFAAQPAPVAAQAAPVAAKPRRSRRKPRRSRSPLPWSSRPSRPKRLPSPKPQSPNPWACKGPREFLFIGRSVNKE